MNKGKSKNCCNHLADIQHTPFDKSSEISVLVGANKPVLHMYTNVRVGKENELNTT